jgi:hypothetical protein
MTPSARWLRRAVEILIPLVVLAVALDVFFDAKAKIDSDEGNWIGTTRYFETFFVDRNFSPEAWTDGYWTRTQPMVFRHLIGSWLWYRGHDLDALNPYYDFSKGIQANRRLGLAPPDDVLNDARMVTRLMSALAVTVLYLVVRVLAGPLGGIVGGLTAATFAIGSPYLQENLIRAKAESTLIFFLLAALLVAVVGLQRARDNRPGLWWGIATGVLLGLAFGSKLTTVLALVAVAIWGAAVCLERQLAPWRARLINLLPLPARAALSSPDSPSPTPSLYSAHSIDAQPPSQTPPLPRTETWRTDSQTPPLHRNGEGAGGWGFPPRRAPWLWPLAVLASAGFIFVITNPFLWPDPLGRTWLLFENRAFEMSEQQQHVPSRAVYGLDRRATLVWDRSVWNDAFAPSRLNLPLEAILTLVGAVWLAVRALAGPRTGWPGVDALVFLWLAITWAGVTAGIGFLLQHYFVPTATIAVLLSGLVVGWSTQLVWDTAARLARVAARPYQESRRPSSATSRPA